MTAPNAESIQFWNDILVPKFDRFRGVFVTACEEHSRGPIERLGLRPGMRVLDVGCGYGETALQMARQESPGGMVLGTDCCAPFLDVARAEAKAAGLDAARFEVADAQTHAFSPEFDVVFARFGTMFFQSPKAAMRNIRKALVPGGRLLMVVWRSLEDNPWMGVPKAIARQHLPPPADDGPSCGPGPFSMADAGVVEAVLTGAGYTDVRFEHTDVVVRVGATLDEAIAFQLTIGPAGEIVREAGALGEQKRELVVSELRAALSKHVRDDGGVYMGTSSWAVTATSP